MTNAYKTAIADASVAEKKPPRIPARTITIRSILGSAPNTICKGEALFACEVFAFWFAVSIADDGALAPVKGDGCVESETPGLNAPRIVSQQANMINTPTRTPGKTPAINMAATETLPDTTAYTIITLLGGMSSPVVAAVVVTATL